MFAALIIDADAEARNAIESSLSPYGLEFTVSHEPSEAMSLARTSTPDIIFLRVELPGASGFSICNKLRRNDETKYIPLIMYASDVADDVFAQHGKLKTRADEYMRLPVGSETLLDTVRTLLPLPGKPKSPPSPSPAAVADDLIEDIDLDIVGELDPIDDDSDFDEVEFGGVEPEVDGAGAAPVVDLGEETDAAFDALTFEDDDDDDFALAPDDAIQPEELDEPDTPAPAPAKRVSEAPPASSILQVAEREPEPVIEAVDPEPVIDVAPEIDGVSVIEQVDEVSVELEAVSLEPQSSGAEARQHESSGNLSARREVLRLKSELNKRERELLTLRDELEGKERGILDAKHRNRQLQGQASEAEARALQLEEQIISAQEQAEAAIQNAETTRKREDGLKTRLEIAQKKAKELDAELSDSNKQRVALDSARSELAAQVEGFAARLQGLEDELGEARELSKAAEDERDGLASALAEQKNAAAELAEQLETLQAASAAQLAERDQQLAERDQQLAEREQQLAERDQQLLERDEQLAERSAQLDERTRQLSERDHQLLERSQQLAELEEKLSTIAEDHQSEVEFYEKRADQMREAADRATSEKQELTDALEQQRAQQAASEASEARLTQRLTELEQQLAARADAARRAQQALAVALKVLD